MRRSVLRDRVHLTRHTGALAIGDAAAIAAFVAIGELTHAGTFVAGLVTFAEFGVAWFVVAGLLGVYGRSPGASGPRRLGRVAGAWVGAVGVAQVLRTAIEASASIAPAFVAVSIGAGGFLLLGWRMIVELVQ